MSRSTTCGCRWAAQPVLLCLVSANAGAAQEAKLPLSAAQMSAVGQLETDGRKPSAS
jgi:hypothetical protein